MGIFYLYTNQDISTDIPKNRQIIRMYKNSISLGDSVTINLIYNCRKDGIITLSEYYKIVESYKLYSKSHSFDQSIARAAQREREFINRKPIH